MVANISIDKSAVATFCQRHHIKRLSLFGSVLRDDFRPTSDVDVLYVFDEQHHPGWDIADIEAELSTLIGRRVGMVPERHLSRWIRDSVLQSAKLLYVEE